MSRTSTNILPTPRGDAASVARERMSVGKAGDMRNRRGVRSQRGFTLVETITAATVFLMATLGVYTMLVKSYQLVALTRVRDDARAVLRTFADQFERLSTTEEVDEVSRQRWLFLPSNGETGRGLVWGALSDENTSVNAEDIASLEIPLGGDSHRVNATLTRDVRYVDASTGQAVTTRTIEAAGYMLSGKFTVRYSLGGKDYTQSITVVRVAP